MNVLFKAVIVGSVGAKLFPEFSAGAWLSTWSGVCLGVVVFYSCVRIVVGVLGWRELVKTVMAYFLIGVMIGLVISLIPLSWGQ